MTGVSSCHQVFLDGEARKDLASFRNLHDAQLDNLVSETAQLLTLEFYRPALLADQGADGVEQGSLPGPVGPDDAYDLSLGHLQADPVEGLNRSIGNVQVLYAEHSVSSSPR